MNGNKKPLVPRLRFPEFLGAEEWENKALADVCLQITNGKANAEDHEEDGVYPLFDRSEVIKKSSDFAFDDEAVIIPGEGMRFQPKYFQGKFNLHQRAYALMKHKGYAKFVYYTLDRFKDVLANNAVKSTVLSLRLPIIERFGLAIPSKDEQQKIADCLSSLDELIAAESQKLTTLKTHKKGLMQQLFPREGETVPRLRFPEFREAGEWKPKTIGNSCESFSGGTPSTTNKSFYGGEIPFIRSAEIDKVKTELFLTNEGLENSAAKLVRAGDILVALYGANSGDVALSKINGAINQAILCLRHETSDRFVYQYLSHKKEWIIATFIQGGQGNLSGEIIKAISLFFPNPSEQEHIADCLSSLDDLITAQTQKIDALKTHKKGLMKQLFPSIMEAI